MDFAISKMSSKGQIVIPSSLRDDLKPGDEFLIVKQDGRIIMKNMNELAKGLKADFVFAERVEKSWQSYDNGKFVSKSKKDFLKDLQKW